MTWDSLDKENKGLNNDYNTSSTLSSASSSTFTEGDTEVNPMMQKTCRACGEGPLRRVSATLLGRYGAVQTGHEIV